MKKRKLPHIKNWPSITENTTISFEDDVYKPLLDIIGTRVSNIDATFINKLYGINKLDELEKLIINSINEYVNLSIDKRKDYSIENIFHMIQLWGGKTGRNIYIMSNTVEDNGKKNKAKGFNQLWDKQKYINIVNKCLEIKLDKNDEINDDDLKGLINVLKTNKICQVGTAFITKHVRFWTQNKLGDNALPIFDSVIKNNLYGIDNPKLTELHDYWKDMIKKSKDKKIKLIPLERGLFLYFRNHAKQKNKKDYKKSTSKSKTNNTAVFDFKGICNNAISNKRDYYKEYTHYPLGIRVKVFGTLRINRKQAFQAFSIINYKEYENKNTIKQLLDKEFSDELENKTTWIYENGNFIAYVNIDPECLVDNKLNETKLIAWFEKHITGVKKIVDEAQ